MFRLFVFWGMMCAGLCAGADTYSLAYQYAKDSGDFAKLTERLQTTDFLTVEDFLKTWKQDRPEFFSTYVTAYRSRSLQQASYKSPRVIMFNRNADLVMSFNGHPRHRGYQNVEMVRFNHDNNSFEFYELTFREGAKAEISAANPAKCLECHQGSARQGVDPRPNWEPYNTWLGFYGSLDDSTELFKKSFPREKNYNPDTDAILLQEFDEEGQKYQEFIYDILPTHPRYSYLDPIVKEYYKSELTLNGEFTNRLATLNNRRVARLMKAETEVYEFVKWTVYGYANCGQRFFVAQDVYKWLNDTTPLKELVRREDSMLPLPRYCSPHNEEMCPPPPSPNDPPKLVYPRVEVADVVNLMFEPFGVKTSDWSMDFKTGARFAAFERFGVANDPRPPFRAAILRVFSEDPDFKDITCEDVEKKSFERFGSLEKVQAFYQKRRETQVPPPPERPLIQRCISCHVSDSGFSGAPAIPFNDPQTLKSELQKEGYKRGRLIDEIFFRIGAHAGQTEQMPPQGIPSETQRTELMAYLKSL